MLSLLFQACATGPTVAPLPPGLPADIAVVRVADGNLTVGGTLVGPWTDLDRSPTDDDDQTLVAGPRDPRPPPGPGGPPWRDPVLEGAQGPREREGRRDRVGLAHGGRRRGLPARRAAPVRARRRLQGPDRRERHPPARDAVAADRGRRRLGPRQRAVPPVDAEGTRPGAAGRVPAGAGVRARSTPTTRGCGRRARPASPRRSGSISPACTAACCRSRASPSRSPPGARSCPA